MSESKKTLLNVIPAAQNASQTQVTLNHPQEEFEWNGVRSQTVVNSSRF